MVNYFKTLLPVTTIFDDLLVPESIDKNFYNEKRYFIAGFHCITWMKFFIIFAMVLLFIFFENIFEDAIYLKAEFYEMDKSTGIIDLLLEWDQNNYSYLFLCIISVIFTIASIFLFTIILEFAYFLLPMQLILFMIFHYLLKKLAIYYTKNLGVIYDMFSDIDYMLAHASGFQERDKLVWREFSFHPKFESIFRNVLFVLGLTICIIIEYFIERVMQFYGYEKFLAKINRPIVIAYRKWQFKKMMSQRLEHQKKKLVKRHQNVNGNYTWNCLLNEYSLHTAISPNSTMMTAVEFTSDEYEIAKKAQATINAKKTQLNKSCKF